MLFLGSGEEILTRILSLRDTSINLRNLVRLPRRREGVLVAAIGVRWASCATVSTGIATSTYAALSGGFVVRGVVGEEGFGVVVAEGAVNAPAHVCADGCSVSVLD